MYFIYKLKQISLLLYQSFNHYDKALFYVPIARRTEELAKENNGDDDDDTGEKKEKMNKVKIGMKQKWVVKTKTQKKNKP